MLTLITRHGGGKKTGKYDIFVMLIKRLQKIVRKGSLSDWWTSGTYWFTER